MNLFKKIFKRKIGKEENAEKIKVSPMLKELLLLQNEVDLLQHEVNSLEESIQTRKPGEPFCQSQALSLIRNNLKRGIYEDKIAKQLQPIGASREWVNRKIEEIKEEMKKDE